MAANIGLLWWRPRTSGNPNGAGELFARSGWMCSISKMRFVTFRHGRLVGFSSPCEQTCTGMAGRLLESRHAQPTAGFRRW